MRKPVVLIFAILLLVYSASVLALYVVSKNSAPEFTSAYSVINKNCERTIENGEARVRQPASQTCDGYGDYRLQKSFGAVAAQISIVNKDESFTLPLEKAGDCLQAYGNKIEWRLANRKPFAVILKVACYKNETPVDGYSYYADENRKGEFVIVRGLKGHERISYEVDAKSAANPVEEARRLAEQGYNEEKRRN
ncbi:MAG: hypothetical protein H0V88_13410 [Pyrinomonadaceae bacterium]|nr:hypothetical protein [Pyrinomonadaceae bacterium]